MTVKNNEKLDETTASFGSPSKTASPTGVRAKKRRADKEQGADPMPKLKTKGAMVKELFDALNSASKDDVAELYKHLIESEDDEEEEVEGEVEEPETDENTEDEGEDEVEESTVTRTPFVLAPVKADDINVDDDVKALFNGEDLSEEFKTSAVVLFKSAIVNQLNKYVTEQNAKIEEHLTAEYTAISEEIVAKLDGYLDHVADAYMVENELAIANGLRVELTEDFIEGLRDLFAEHYISVPEDKEDLVEALAERVEALEEELNTTINEKIDLEEQVETFQREEILSQLKEGLSGTEFDKFKLLAEGVDYINDEDFTKKVSLIKEKHFNGKPSKPTTLPVDRQVITESVDDNSIMSAVTRQLERQLNR